MDPVTVIGICSAMLIAGITEKHRKSSLVRVPAVKSEKPRMSLRKRSQSKNGQVTCRKTAYQKS